MYFAVKVLLSALIVALISEIAKRSPALGALVASLPLVSVLGMIWIWRDTRDPVRMAAHSQATFWYVLPSLPMFLGLSQVFGLAKQSGGGVSIDTEIGRGTCACRSAVSTLPRSSI